VQYCRPAANPISTRLHPQTPTNGDLFKAISKESTAMGLGAGDEEDAKPARPFFDIELDDASFSTKEPAPVFLGSEPPMPVQIGSLGAAAEPTPSPSPQLTGNVATVDGMFTFPAPVEATKEGFRWGQFFIGLIAPHTIFFLLAIIASLPGQGGEEMPDFYRFEDVSLSPDSEGWYNVTVEKSLAESVNIDIDLESTHPEYRSVVMNYWADDVDWEGNGLVFETSYNSSNGDYSETDIGEFTYANQTLWFKLEGPEAQTYNVTLAFHDLAAEEAWWDEHGGAEEVFSFILFCGMPVAFVIGTIAAFVRGNRALGIGLLSSIPAAFIFLPVMAILLLIMFGL